MSLFVCSKCKNIENTALSGYWFDLSSTKKLCSECDPKIGRWHNRFPKEKFNKKKWRIRKDSPQFVGRIVNE